MAVNKVMLANGEVLIDLTNDTVSEDTLVEGVTAHDKSGNLIIGTLNTGEGAVAEYTRVGYIQFTGKQTVDTGVVCTEDTRIKIVFTREYSAANYLYGVSSTDNTASVTAYLSSGGAWRFGNKSASITLTSNEDLVHTAVVNKTGIIRAGTTQSFSGTNGFKTVATLTLGSCRNSNGTLGSAQYVGKIYIFEMWQGDELVLKLIPVINKNGVYGFLDTVTHTFLESITTTPLDGE